MAARSSRQRAHHRQVSRAGIGTTSLCCYRYGPSPAEALVALLSLHPSLQDYNTIHLPQWMAGLGGMTQSMSTSTRWIPG